VLDALGYLALSGLALSRDGGLFSKLRHGVKAVWVAQKVDFAYDYILIGFKLQYRHMRNENQR